MSFTKHRDASEVFAVDFAALLEAGETIASVDALRVHKAAGGVVSAEFGAPAGTINGTMVEFTLGATAANQQAAGFYIVYCEVTTSAGETLVETPSLRIIDTASIT